MHTFSTNQFDDLQKFITSIEGSSDIFGIIWTLEEREGLLFTLSMPPITALD